jgi:hypothetical protein
MKLPEEMHKALNAPFFEDRYEAIVRDCAKVVREQGTKHRPLNKAADAVLARYGLEQ